MTLFFIKEMAIFQKVKDSAKEDFSFEGLDHFL